MYKKNLFYSRTAIIVDKQASKGYITNKVTTTYSLPKTSKCVP